MKRRNLLLLSVTVSMAVHIMILSSAFDMEKKMEKKETPPALIAPVASFVEELQGVEPQIETEGGKMAEEETTPPAIARDQQERNDETVVEEGGESISFPGISAVLPATAAQGLPPVQTSSADHVAFEQLQGGESLPLPEYPPDALTAGIEGEVTVQIVIGTSGEVSSAQIVRSSGYDVLDEACLSTIRSSWKFDSSETIRVSTKRFVFSLR